MPYFTLLDINNLRLGHVIDHCSDLTLRPLGYEKVYLPLREVADSQIHPFISKVTPYPAELAASDEGKYLYL